MRVSMATAKSRLCELIRAVEAGEQVTVCRRGIPVVDIVRAPEPKRKIPKFGTLRDQIQISDPDWWKPMSEEEVSFMFGVGQ